ncbi:aldo/keto reductase [Lacticaseibacillus sharpeae]|uniref:Aldo keto reductase n=1 Tax=Lacticaseibacillus sharpeae JCM 1186 = DSM 20505 TaxID=1291052 RepID=A0A0R1ZLH2_9LACO|nr:aldo/keto reductase [Lacticaseibacillus sharpeae]KRM55242.1 aldo keto reductase [Lacticaseibacillus sharpeae JCM 1186 = DSM 20505]
MSIITDPFTLPNGVKIPQVGFGTWQIPAGDVAYTSVANALKAGYRHIDTATAYRNEASVGAAIRDSGIARDQIFVTSKLPAEAKTYADAAKAIDESLTKLDLGYIDLYLIHAPWPWAELGADYKEGNAEAWRAMEDAYDAGKFRAIGISNFNVADQEYLYAHSRITPMALQLQFYIGYREAANVDCARAHGLLVEGFSPLATGFLFGNQDVAAIAGHYDVTVAQLAIRYVLQNGIVPLPKAIGADHVVENTKLDFIISPADMAALNAMNDTAPGEDHNEY